jgi:hypothetical protein
MNNQIIVPSIAVAFASPFTAMTVFSTPQGRAREQEEAARLDVVHDRGGEKSRRRLL